MIKNRIAGTAALATFGLAVLAGIPLAAPGNADAGSGRSSASGGTSTASQSATASETGEANGYGDMSSNGPTSKVGSSPTPSVSASGGALTSSDYTQVNAADAARLASLNNNLQADMSMIANVLDKMNQLNSTIARIGG